MNNAPTIFATIPCTPEGKQLCRYISAATGRRLNETVEEALLLLKEAYQLPDLPTVKKPEKVE